ncbi:MAG: transcription-repair coupling factor [Clostridiales bacterium]|nr:transcription-repair coupling factor [Candidatus Crickella merdequi]
MINNYTGISGSRIAFLAAAALKENNKLLIVVSSGRVAERLREDLAFFAPDARIEVLPEDEDRILYEAKDRESLISRIKGIQAILSDSAGNEIAVIAPVSAVLRPMVKPARFKSHISVLEAGQVIDPSELKELLVESGYEAVTVTESVGEFTSRGGIIDVYTPSYDNPLRIEFFDDEIDSIRIFDKDTQRSLENMTAAVITPAAEFIPTAAELSKMLLKADLDDAVKEKLSERTDVLLYADYMEYFDVETVFLWDYMDAGRVIVCDPSRIMEEIPDYRKEDDLFGIYKTEVDIYTPFPERIRGVSSLDKIINVKSRQVAAFNGQMELLVREVKGLIKSGYQVRIVSSSEERSERIREYFLLDDVDSGITYLTGALSAGFISEDAKLCYIAESDVFPKSRRKPLKRKKKSEGGMDFSDLHKGDYVVHETHGIGKFEGIKPMTADGETRDYLVIRYAGSDVLYIPTEQLDIIQKYIGSGGNAPNLSKLSGGTWRNTRERARKAIMEIAEDLVKLYAEREAAGGYAFPEDSIWQAEFEDAFPYTETEDQLRAIAEIKEDMEKPLPMDRLLCGDVGYGKTEVAARAIFKCISDGKQAALLAPTTLLVNQHYHNLRERFDGYPFEVEMLSRFRDKSKQDEIVKRVKKGTVDLIIGTHRLLSQDVDYKDLGLLVIDEEQRFGVKHKEKIKQLKSNVDVLTLSATPIPRTLNMSLTGIKNISTIEEPPTDRYPVQIYVTPYDEQLIKRVIERELARGGQVYVVSNRVTGIVKLAEKIEELVPEAKVAVGHGRMSETALENTMLDFVDGETNVLVATTIIENGIDIANANTMIVLNADMLGLAQLYQLRGRVGRSNRIAYAYLMYQPQKVMTEIARKRLIAIREFTEFGAGFKLAMRDLELRGAGNILGEAQSGHIEGIGYELYCKEVDRAVRMLKGENVTEARADITIEIRVAASIPSTYIEDETLKLQAYKKIAGISSEEDSLALSDELIDRFGDMPSEVQNLIDVAEIRSHAERLGIDQIAERGTRIVLTPGEISNISAYILVMAKEAFGEELTITSGRSTAISLYTGKGAPVKKLLSLMRTMRNAWEEERNSSK